MRVTFVYPDLLECVPSYRGAFYSGVAILSAVLKAEGHETTLIHITDPSYGEAQFAKDIKTHRPDLIAFSSTTNGYPVVRMLASYLHRTAGSTPTIYGGIHPTLAPYQSIDTPGIDMICLGEGDLCLAQVCRSLEEGREVDNIAGLWVKKDGAVVRNLMPMLVSNLDTLPFADRDLFQYPSLYNERLGNATFMASRGCPYSCNYCSNRGLRKIYSGKGRYVRFRSVDNLMVEIREVLERYAFVRRIHFDDDILFMRREWALEFTQRYPKEIGLPFYSNIHPRLCTPETVALLAQAGCKELRIGLESGNRTIRKEVLNRNMDNEVIIKAFHLARDYGIRVKSFNMIGLPHENASGILDTVKLNARAMVDEIQLSIFHPYPGTVLYDMCHADKLVSNRRVSSYYMGSILDLPDLTGEQLRMFQRYFHTFAKVYMAVYRLPKTVVGIAERILDYTLSNRSTPVLLRMTSPFPYAIKSGIRVLKNMMGKGRDAVPPPSVRGT